MKSGGSSASEEVLRCCCGGRRGGARSGILGGVAASPGRGLSLRGVEGPILERNTMQLNEYRVHEYPAQTKKKEDELILNYVPSIIIIDRIVGSCIIHTVKAMTPV